MPGPGLLTAGNVALNRAKRTFSLPFACQAGGTISVTAQLGDEGDDRARLLSLRGETLDRRS